MSDAPRHLSEIRDLLVDSDLFALLWTLSKVTPGATAIGGVGPYAREPVRLRGHLSMSFPRRDVAEISLNSDSEREPGVALDVAFLTLYGVDSPLAPHITEMLLREDDPETRERVREFLDLFNHRLLSLLYRAWARYRLCVSTVAWGEDNLSRNLTDLLDLPALPEGTGLSTADLLPLAGLFFARPRSARGLEQVLRALLPTLELAVLSCVPREVRIPRADRCRLGLRRSRIGRDLFLGDTIWDATSLIRVKVGPVRRVQVSDLQVGGASWRRIAALVHTWSQEPFPWELEILLDPTELSGARLCSAEPGTRLGVDSWLGEPPEGESSIFVQPPSGELYA